MWNGIEKRFDIRIDNPVIALPLIKPDALNRHTHAAPLAVGVGTVFKFGFDFRRQHQCQAGLQNAVTHRGYRQSAR